MLLWNYEEIKAGWAWAKPANLRKLFLLQTYKFWQNQETPEARLARKEADPNLDPHYKLMLRNLYPETPLVHLSHFLQIYIGLTSFPPVVVGCCCGYLMGSWIRVSLWHGLDTAL